MAQWGMYNDRGELLVYDDNLPHGREVVQPSGLNFGFPTGDVTNPTSLNQAANALGELATLHDTVIAGGNAIATGTGGANPINDSAKSPVTTVSRPWLEPPQGTLPFHQQQVVTMPAVAASAVVVSLVVPFGYDGVINTYSWNDTGGGFVQGSGDLQVQILRNGGAVRNYDNILVEKGTMQIPRPISPLRVYSGQVITLVVNHIANILLAGNIVGCFSGYFYPSMS